MAGKSNKGRNRRPAAASSSNSVVNSSAAAQDNTSKDELSASEAVQTVDNGVPSVEESAADEVEVKDSETDVPGGQESQGEPGTENPAGQPKQGDLHLYPISVETQSGEKLQLQLNPGDSVMDIRQFLLDAPETCFFTCYDLVLHTKDGSTHHLQDFNEISEVADITTGGCFLEMVPALYDDRSIRAHVHRTRDLLSLSTLHSSLSTSLALKYEKAQKTAAATGVTVKTEIPELDGLGFMDDATSSLSNLLSLPLKEIKCVESIVFSSFNPPPSYRRLVGDLIYLDVVTLEGNQFCITGTTRSFYVNSNSLSNTLNTTLNPKPTKAYAEATTLVEILQKISSKFQKAFREILERKECAHPFENVQSLLPPNSWLGLHPVPDHRRDAARAEDALTLSYGSELVGMQRDWNEELQSCREFPHTTPQERIMRDRALYKVTSDFVDAAISGATGVISRCIPPINPTDPECFHMYVHNNIFFSFAVDADLEQLSKNHVSDSNLKNRSTGTLHSSEKSNVSLLHRESESSNGEKCDVSCAGECRDAMKSTAETQLGETEQATYASANNDLKGTKAYQEADVPGLYNLAMVIIDYRGHRVVAQSVLPGILQGDKSDSLLYGSVDNGKKICWNEEFHSKVVEAAKCLHLKEHTVLDGAGNVFKLAAPVECKGIVGTDDRHYLLDLMRVTPRDANFTGSGSRFCILRPELITSYCQVLDADNSKSKSTCEEGAQLTADGSIDKENLAEKENITEKEKTNEAEEVVSSPSEITEPCEEFFFNPNVFTDFKLAGSAEEIQIDEEKVRKASLYLTDVVLPKFIQDLCTLEVSPMDGQTLTEALHAHGINVRYIGKVAEGTRHLPHLLDLCCNEIVVRSAKHILKDVLRDTDDHDVGPAICHFLNCFSGSYQAVGSNVNANSSQSRSPKKEQAGPRSPGSRSNGQGRWKGGASTKKNTSSYLNVSSESLWSDIQEFAKLKYEFELPKDARTHVKKDSVIRNLCQKVGITIAARRYDLNSAAPFEISDILDLQPVVKHSVPVCSDAKALVETGKIQLAEGMLSEAYTVFSEAFSILQQVTGPMHREVANCCRYLAMVLYHAGDMTGAIMQQHKELIINERCLGLDHPDTAHSYGNMALFYHGLNQTELALQHMSRALLLLYLSSGPDHPDVAATFINVAMMYQDLGKMEAALRYLQEALKKNERLLGEEHIQTAVCYHALAIAFNCMGAFKLSHQNEKKTYDILVKQLGEEDSRTRDSEKWMKTFKLREQQLNAQKQKGQALNAAQAQKAIDLLKANPDLAQAIHSAALAGGSGSSNVSVNRSLDAAAIMGETFPRGRGVDERAARAVAANRKKAAARGLLRPNSVPVEAYNPLAQIMNIVSAAGAPDSAQNGDRSGLKEANDHLANGRADVKTSKPSSEQEGQPPVGLGKGLAALDGKKQKSKP